MRRLAGARRHALAWLAAISLGAPVTAIAAAAHRDDMMHFDAPHCVDLMRALVARGRAEDALVAALLVHVLPIATPPVDEGSVPSTTELLRRAESLAPSDPLVAWLSVMIDCGPEDSSCDAEPGIQRLVAIDPHNAYPWTLALAAARQRKDPVAEAQALSKAAAADRFDDYSWDFTRRAIMALRSLSLRPSEREELSKIGPSVAVDPERLQSMLVLQAMLASRIPNLHPIDVACTPPASGSADAARRRDCRGSRLPDVGASSRWHRHRAAVGVATGVRELTARRDLEPKSGA